MAFAGVDPNARSDSLVEPEPTEKAKEYTLTLEHQKRGTCSIDIRVFLRMLTAQPSPLPNKSTPVGDSASYRNSEGERDVQT